MKELGPKATLADAAKDKQIMKLMSDSEAKDIIEKLKPVIDGEQEFLLRGAKGPKQKKARAFGEPIFGFSKAFDRKNLIVSAVRYAETSTTAYLC